MELGARIKACRLELGLSQRQLCGDYMTRNMLSQIESGTARPSMDTLAYLAERLGKSISFFLEEHTVTSQNQACMARARAALASGSTEQLEAALRDFRQPDETFGEERILLQFQLFLQKAQRALQNAQQPYAVSLLRQALALEGLYITADLRRRCLLLLGQAGEKVALPSEDEALLVLATQTEDLQRRRELLTAVEDRSASQWHFLTAETEFALGNFAEAAAHYGCCRQTPAILARQEACYRELGDFKRAYEFACLQREQTVSP